MEMKNENLIFTTSWDDGHPLDHRVADLLTKYNFRGTFYAPCRNSEGRETLSGSALRAIGETFEIGAHTLDHCYLDSVDLQEVKRQVTEGKRRLEDDLGRSVNGFCYPGGKHNKAVRKIVSNAGFSYARTIANLHLTMLNDPFLMPTTIQFYPHNRNVYIRNFIKHRCWNKRARLFKSALKPNIFMERLKAMLDEAYNAGGVFHLWGHSWEIDKFDGWRKLDDFLRYASGLVERDMRFDNGSLFRKFYVS